jgi:hypothetical protein
MSPVAGRDRPARWPWVVVALAIGSVLGGLVFVIASGETVAHELTPIVAFTTCAVVGGADRRP